MCSSFTYVRPTMRLQTRARVIMNRLKYKNQNHTFLIVYLEIYHILRYVKMVSFSLAKTILVQLKAHTLRFQGNLPLHFSRWSRIL